MSQQIGHGIMMLSKKAMALLLGIFLLCLAACGGNYGAVHVQNVFDEMLTCDFVEFAKASDATYESEKFMLDDGFGLRSEEEGVPVRYRLGRYFDDDEAPYKLVFSKTVYVPVSDGGVLRVEKSEVYSGKTLALRKEETAYRKSDPRDGDIQSDPERNEYHYASIGAEEAEMEIESAGVGELFERLMGSPSEYFVDAYFEYNASSSYSNSNPGSFDDCRGR